MGALESATSGRTDAPALLWNLAMGAVLGGLVGCPLAFLVLVTVIGSISVRGGQMLVVLVGCIVGGAAAVAVIRSHEGPVISWIATIGGPSLGGLSAAIIIQISRASRVIVTMPGKFQCPVCGYPELTEPPRSEGYPSHEICPCCGFEFGFDDDSQGISYEQYRTKWIREGFPWFYEREGPPADWDPREQLRLLGVNSAQL